MPRRCTRPAAETRHASSAAHRREGVYETAGDLAPTEEEIRRHRAELARLLPLWPHELTDTSPAGTAHILAVLERALRAERRRGLAGHWTYNLSRHAQLLRAYQSFEDGRAVEPCRRTPR